MQDIWKQTRLIYAALLIGQLLFCLVLIYLIYGQGYAVEEGQFSEYRYLGALIIALAAFAAFGFNRLRKQQATQLKVELPAKLMHYRTTVMMRSAILEAGNLFCLILVFLTGSMTSLLYFGVGILIFIYFRPSQDDILKSYQLNSQDSQTLQNLGS